MRSSLPVLLVLLLVGIAYPALAAEGNRVGYVTFEEARVQLLDGNARVDVDYSVDPGMGLIILLFGSGDLQKKIERSLNFPSARPEEVGLTHAVFLVDHAAEDYGDHAYWFPGHRFGVTFPAVEVRAPGYSLFFPDAGSIPKSFGYFSAGS
ncbi:MAG TPA: hypothetical protein VKO45_03140 [Methanomicrobiales archaeon]|nr:hypothetical protein [Methanomicrobiales archaeon]